MKKDIIKEITEDMVNTINEHGTKWLKNWVGDSGMPINMVSKANYSGFNFFILTQQHRQSETWATLKQYKNAGIRVRYEEMSKATPIIYFQMIEDKRDPEKKIPLLKNYRVWNLDQTEGFTPEQNENPVEFNHEIAEKFVKNTGANIQHKGNRAFYSSMNDKITMPPKTSFIDTADANAEQNYYGTLFHELTHWTGHKTRMNRKLANQFGSSDYAFEELVAELGACFQSVKFGIEPQEINVDHKKYIASWLKALKDDVKFIYKASAQANKSLRFLESLQKEEAEKVA